MPIFNVPIDNIATGSSAGTWKTIASVIVDNAAGHRVRIRRIELGFGDASPQDMQVRFRIVATDGTTAGTPGTTVSAANVAKLDADSANSSEAAGLNYSSEPTTYGSAMWEAALNTRGTATYLFGPDDAPVLRGLATASADMVLGLQATPEAAAAADIVGSMQFETF